MIEIREVSIRVNALEGGQEVTTHKLDSIQKTVNDIYWHLINKNDKIVR
jgi:hypothetical protein